MGDPTLLSRRAVSIVGARIASAAGQRFARTLAADLGDAGFVVVSGMARGIDAAAHEGALPFGTVAVLAGGADDIYPPEHRGLHAEIARLGCVVSERPIGHNARAADFPRRNRIISGLALGVVVVEAELKSGSLITARLANEQGREVFAVPGSPMDPRSRGTNDLLRQGATLVEEAADVIRVFWRPRPSRPSPGDRPPPGRPNPPTMSPRAHSGDDRPPALAQPHGAGRPRARRRNADAGSARGRGRTQPRRTRRCALRRHGGGALNAAICTVTVGRPVDSGGAASPPRLEGVADFGGESAPFRPPPNPRPA